MLLDLWPAIDAEEEAHGAIVVTEPPARAPRFVTVSGDLKASWSVRSRATADLTAAWEVQAIVEALMRLGWEIKPMVPPGMVMKSLSISWDNESEDDWLIAIGLI